MSYQIKMAYFAYVLDYMQLSQGVLKY